jgi:MFS family permease
VTTDRATEATTGWWPARNTVLALCVLAFFSTMVARLVVSPVVPAVRTEFGVTDGAVGLALTGMWVAYALTHYPSGVLGDRFGERRVVLGAVGLTAVGGVVLAAAPSFPVFGLVAVVLGAAAGLYYPSGASLLSKRFTNVGQAMGFHIAGASLAGLVTPVAVSLIATRAGWRVAMLLAPAIAVPVWLLFAWRVRPRAAAGENESEGDPEDADEGRDEAEGGADDPATGAATAGGWWEALRAVAATLARPVMAYTVVLAAVQTFVFSATLSFLPTFLRSHHDTGSVRASVLFSLFFVVLGVAQPSAGRVSDRIGRDTTAALAFGTAAVGYAVLVVGGSTAILAGGVVLAGLGMSSVVPLESKFMDNIALGDRGTDFGTVRMTYVLLGASGSAVTGGVADAFGWVASISLFVAVLGAAAVASALSSVGAGR